MQNWLECVVASGVSMEEARAVQEEQEQAA
jgi:hypothetical protein